MMPIGWDDDRADEGSLRRRQWHAKRRIDPLWIGAFWALVIEAGAALLVLSAIWLLHRS
jgi:hypothetical protein